MVCLIVISFNKCSLVIYRAYHIWSRETDKNVTVVINDIRRNIRLVSLQSPRDPMIQINALKIFCHLYSILTISFITANIKYYNYERESHLQWSDYVTGSRESILLVFVLSILSSLEATFPSVRALSHLHLKQQ